MQCPNCRNWNEVGSLFCEQCGFELVEGASEAVHSPPIVQEQVLVAVNSPASTPPFSGARLVLRTTGSIFKLGEVTLIGREDPGLQIDFDGYPDGQYISHHHARISQINGRYYVEDLGSSNYTRVNGIKLVKGQVEPLDEGDTLRFGKIEVTFHSS